MDKKYPTLLLLLILILHLKEWLAILDGELCDHCAYLKNFPVTPDVLTDEAPVDGLMMHPDLALHCKVLHWIVIVLRALVLVGMPAVAIVGLDSPVGPKKMAEDHVENLDVGLCPGPAWGIPS